MDLPTELRCHIYSYMPDIVYDPVFSKPGICSWEVYRMPTALLLLNKTVYEEVKHPSIQKPLQKFNNQLLPKIVLGPTHTEINSIYIMLSETFHQAGKRLHTFLGEFQERGDEVKNISLELASWYNNTYLPQQVPDGHQEALDTQNECKPERLYRFVRQTLRRMAIRKACEIRIRILVYPMGHLPRRENRSMDINPPSSWGTYEQVASRDTTRQNMSSRMGRESEIVFSLSSLSGLGSSAYDAIRCIGVNIRAVKARKRDRNLFDINGIEYVFDS
jgi:hypothetical protein